MIVRLLLVLPLLGFLAPPASSDDKDYRKEIQTLINQGRGTAAGRAAWGKIIDAGPDLLPALLEAMDTTDIVAANWLRTAFDRIVDREIQAGGKGLDADALLNFARDSRRQGRARRLALERVEQLRPGTSSKLFPGWLEDAEFRFEAVALALDEAKKLVDKGAKKKAVLAYEKAFVAARDVRQVRQAAAALLELGSRVSVGRHLGFLVDWYLVGPFDGMGMRGFRTEYPPEKKVDLSAEYQGQGKKVRWVRYQVREPAPTSGGHQALVNLRERDALGDADDAVAFAYTEFTVAKAQEVEFRGAADDNFTVYVNGKREFGFEEYRNGVRHDRHRFKVRLRAGKNTVLVKVCQTPAPNPEPNWEFFLRVVDATGRGIVMHNALPAVKK